MFRARATYAARHGLPFGEFAAWDPHDQDVALSVGAYESQVCSGCGVHPDVWKPTYRATREDVVVPEWVHCRVCELVKRANDAGPPSEDPGWHLTLKVRDGASDDSAGGP